ncbi:peptidase M10A [Actinokineospora auranticolor]|uniref:peptidase M10A n=1 Tax=Actinokineospora auranticolor TaxID=155976 RepID=UPI001FE2D338|nr:peptidase M10A [Actinokineospora auranticolor]
MAGVPGSEGTAPEEELHVVGEAIYAADVDDAQYAGATVPRDDTSCSDSSYALKTWKVAGTLNWLYNGDGVPPAVASTALGAITASGDTVAKGANRCGLPASFTTVYKYAGTTTAKPQVASDLTCTGNDNKSVTGWGSLPPKVLAYTCTYFNSKGVVIATDLLIDNVAYTWFTTKPATCSGQLYDLETTMTHERLHTAGLAHVDQTRNAAQTMTPASAPCDTSRRLLGAGDYAGLKAAGTQ